MPARPRVSSQEILALIGLCEEGLSGAEVFREMREKAQDNGWLKRDPKTIRRFCLMWEEYQAESSGDSVTARDRRLRRRDLGGMDSAYENFVHLMRTRSDKSSRSSLVSDELRRLHLAQLTEFADSIRTCLYHPHLEVETLTMEDFDSAGVPQFLTVKGVDWSLDPNAWLSVTTPDFGEADQWGEMLPLFREHTKDSPFWKHLEELAWLPTQLSAMYCEAAARLSETDGDFATAWSDFKSAMAWAAEYSRTSLFPRIPEGAAPPYGAGFAAGVMKRFAAMGYPVYEMQHEMRRLLQELNLDMSSPKIELAIVNGSCERCK
jgi:hypothetical protein